MGVDAGRYPTRIHGLMRFWRQLRLPWRAGLTQPDEADLRALADRLMNPQETQRFQRSNAQFNQSGMADFLFATDPLAVEPRVMFNRLRWGGQLIVTSPQHRVIEAACQAYQKRDEFVVESWPQALALPRFEGWPGFLPRNLHYGVIRKVHLVWADEITDRHSYYVRLQPDAKVPEGCVVVKQVPTYDHVAHRLMRRFPEITPERARKGARKLVEKVFPLFLTREAAFLKLLQRDLPASHRQRVPTVLHAEYDERGLVQKLHLNWLRLGGQPLSLLEFARQSTELLAMLHDGVGVIHMDLRLDNIVVTDNGVGFVDFGSAVRVGESFDHSPMLQTLFGEMLSSSQIQRDLGKLRESGRVTSSLFVNAYQKIDKAVDLFYLVLQMNQPQTNPDLRGLVQKEPRRENEDLAELAKAILRPADPEHPQYRSAGEVLAAITDIRARSRVA